MLPLETSGLTTALQGLDVKPELITAIVNKLTEAGDGLGVGFEDARLTPQEFGNRESAATLGSHYDRAFEVMQATIDGIATDLLTFGTHAKDAATYVDKSDQATAADLAAARASVEDLGQIAANSHGDRAHDRAKNAQDPSGQQPLPSSGTGA